MSSFLDQFVTIGNAKAWNATDEKTIFFCDLTGFRASNTQFQDYLEEKFEELLTSSKTSV